MERAFWLLGGNLSKASTNTESSRLASYPWGGFYVFRDPRRDSRLVFRTGPAEGAAVSAGHAHSDLLSVYLSAYGQPFIVDSGTYTYRCAGPSRQASEPDWRRYLRGPAAHNGLAIDGRDALGEVSRDFRDSALETFVSLEKNQDAPVASWVQARMVGGGPYASHRRGVVQVREEYFVVYDLLGLAIPKEGRHFGFQFSPDVDVGRFGARGLRAQRNNESLVLVGSSNLAEPLSLVGSRDPLGGWVSRRYGELQPAPQARFGLSPETTTAAFLLRTAESPKSTAIEVKELGTVGIRIAVSLGEIEDTLLLNLGSSEAELHVDDIRFTGELLWIRSRRGNPSALRWLNGALVDWSARGIRVASAERAPSLQIDADGVELAVRHVDPASLSIHWRS
jgi:hypothetical protein